jgi:hypothetical protein
VGQGDVGKLGSRQTFGVVRADSDTHVDGVMEGDGDWCGGDEIIVRLTGVDGELIAFAFDAEAG